MPGGGIADNVILGLSMGGVISRWALRDMETRLGQQHNTRMFISMDAPQQGANVPAAYQHLARHARSLYLQTGATAALVETIQFFANGLSPFRVLSLSDRPASRQMLINWVNGSGNIDNTFHDGWQTELRNLGYPTQDNIRNIAISNGAECGTTQPFAPGAELLNLNGKANTRFLGDILGQIGFPLVGSILNWPGFFLGVLPGRNDIKYEFIANAQPSQGVSQRIYKGKISYTKKVLWVIPVNVTITERNNNSNTTLLPMDYYAGGELNIGADVNDINFQNALVRFNMSFSQIPTFNFIPTPSALDIGLNNVTLNNADYLAAYVGGAPPITPKNSPFHNFVTAFNDQRRNEQHIGFFTRNGNWLAAELTQTGNPPPNAPIANCIAFCENGTISGATSFCNSETFTAPFGNDVTYDWLVDQPWLVTTQPFGNTFEVTRAGSAGGSLVITVQITGDCGSTTLTHNVIMGSPAINYTITPSNMGNECYQPNNFYFFSIEPGANDFQFVTGYEWGYRPFNTTNETIVGDPNQLNTMVTIVFPLTGLYEVFVRPRNTCGAGTESTYPLEVVAICGGGGWFRVSTSPNPAKDDIYVTITDERQEVKNLKSNDNVQMILYDFNSMQMVRQWKRKNDQKQYRLDTRNVKKGMYVLVVTKGKYQQTQKVIIE